jgi:hypothetical protein
MVKHDQAIGVKWPELGDFDGDAMQTSVTAITSAAHVSHSLV